MPKIRVVHIITGLAVGGAETMLAKLLASMDSNRYEQSVIVLMGKGKVAAQIEALGIDVQALGLQGIVSFLFGIFRLRSLVRELKPDIVQSWLYHADLAASLATKGLQPKHLVWNVRCSNMDFADYRLSTRLICFVLARISHWPDAVISNSIAGIKTHAALGYHPRSWKLLPNGFDVDRFKPDPVNAALLRTSIGVKANEKLIVLPARFDPMKDHTTFFRAASIALKSRNDLRFLLVGRELTPQNEAINALILANGLQDRTVLLGERPDMNTVMACADLVTLSSAYGEGFPNVIGEAMSSGALCVVTDVGDSGVIVGTYGRVVQPRAPDQLAEAWLDLLSLSDSEQCILRQQGRQHVIDHYSLAIVARSYQDFYTSALQ